MSEAREIKHVVSKKIGKNRVKFHIYDDGETSRTFEVVESTDPSSGKKSKEEVWRERQELVKFPNHILKNQDYDAARQEWIEKYKMRSKKLHDTRGECRNCDADGQEIWVHVFDNDAEERREYYNFKYCPTCTAKTAIPRSNRSTPYDELEEPVEKEE